MDDLDTKQKDFLEKYGKLVEETGMDFANFPVYIPDGNGGFRTVINSVPVDMSKQAKKSPFMAK